MSRFSPTSAVIGWAAVLLAPLARAGGVRIVEPTGTQNFADIQSAVNAAPDGAVLLVGQGSYPGFTVSGKSLSILAVPNSAVSVTGRIAVSAIAANQVLVLSGLDVAPANGSGLAALETSNCSGHVRLQDCTFQGADYAYVWCEDAQARDAPPAARVTGCTKTAFTACSFRGGKGEDSSEETAMCQFFDGGGDGGAGLVATSSTVVLYDCQLTGGTGGSADYTSGGTGGDGATLSGSAAFASACSFSGGDGGYVYHLNCGGTGGAGCAVANGSVLDEIGCTFQGGFEGCPPVSQAPGVTGGPVNPMTGPAREAVIGPKVQVEQSPWSVAFQGAPFDRPFLFASLIPNTKIWIPFHGAWLTLRAALLPPATLPQAGANGDVNASVPTPDLPAGSLYQRRFSHVAVRGSGLVYLGSGAVLYLLDRQSGPDCNGNGVSDLVDVIEGTSADANHNLIPDSCPGG